MTDENINSLYGGNYLKIEEVPKAGELECEVTGYFIKDFQDQKTGATTRKLVLELASGKQFALNTINAKRLAKNFGTPDYTKWPGRKFRVKRDETEFGGQDVLCIRVVKEAEAA